MTASNLISHISNLKSFVIIVAGGSGSRMRSAVPKQFLLLNGKPVLMHTIDAFRRSDTQPLVIVAIHPDFHSYWQQLCSDYNFDTPHQLVNGGETRFHSVKNALDIIADEADTTIAVHDGARPLTSKQIIDASYKDARDHGNAVTAVRCRDSVRQVKDSASVSLARDEIYLVQTPQTFRSAQIKKAYLLPYSDKFTDDAGVVEQTGVPIRLIEGSYDNIKITFPEDIAIAEVILRGR